MNFVHIPKALTPAPRSSDWLLLSKTRYAGAIVPMNCVSLMFPPESRTPLVETPAFHGNCYDVGQKPEPAIPDFCSAHDRNGIKM